MTVDITAKQKVSMPIASEKPAEPDTSVQERIAFLAELKSKQLNQLNQTLQQNQDKNDERMQKWLDRYDQYVDKNADRMKGDQ